MKGKNGYGYEHPEHYDEGSMISYILATSPSRVPLASHNNRARTNDSANADNKVFVCDICKNAWRWNIFSNKNKTPEYCNNIPKYGKKHIDCPICTGEFKIETRGE